MEARQGPATAEAKAARITDDHRTGESNELKLAQHSAIQLISLDHLQWLRNGRDGANHLHCSQSSISRQSRLCLDLLSLKTRKIRGELLIEGNTSLLRELRRVHQLCRISGLDPIRVEAPPEFARNTNIHEKNTTLSVACTLPREGSAISSLLAERVIDLWITQHHPITNRPSTRDTGANRANHDFLTVALNNSPFSLHSLNGASRYLTCLPELAGTPAFEAALSIMRTGTSAHNQSLSRLN